MRRGGRSSTVRLLAALAVVVLAGCRVDCETGSCYPHGTYVDRNDALGASTAEICFDGVCTTVATGGGPDDVFSGFNVDTWEQGRTVELAITVFDENGKVIDALTETRTMDSNRCACGVLFYEWKDGTLRRSN